MRTVDLFAGAGGFSEGARQAGCTVLWAGNHKPSAVKWHSKNHAGTHHVCQDLQQADWSHVPGMDLLIASPACQGHSHARGKDRPKHDADRSTAWAVVSCAEYHRPSVVLVENVSEFQEWVLYPAWELALQRLGYTLVNYVLDAADFGVPQNRIRLFIVATQSKAPLFITLPKREHKPADVEWEAGIWSPIYKPGRAPATLQRVENGQKQHGKRFLMSYYGNSRGGRAANRPLGTVTTVDKWALVRGNEMRMLSVDEYRRAMGFPADYNLPASKKEAIDLLGNAVCPPVAKELIQVIRGRA